MIDKIISLYISDGVYRGSKLLKLKEVVDNAINLSSEK